MQTRNWIGLATAAGAAAVASGAYLRYRRELNEKAQKLEANSFIANTKCGRIEYGREGKGRAALVIHGAGGGYDQGLYLAREMLGEGFDVIAPSRFGYLRTPVPADASHVAQADAHAALLDKLSVQKTIVMGVSAGAPSAIEFASRYPERTTALVLVVPRTYHPDGQAGAQPTPQNKAVIRLFENSVDFPYWAATKVGRKTLVRFFGVDPALEAKAAPEDREKINALLAEMLPLSARAEGIMADTASEWAKPDLEGIQCPTLVISAEDDLYDTLPGARFAAEQIPDATLKVFKTGGHLLISHRNELRGMIADFLTQHKDDNMLRSSKKVAVGLPETAATH